MIKLQAEKYCHNCPEFSVASETTYYTYKAKPEVNTVLSCVHKNECLCIKEYLENGGEEDRNHD